jgi:putative flippase GtrA
LKRFLRYVVVGLLVNSGGYLIYLLITSLWDQPKTVMSSLYIFGVATSFYFNRQWTFNHSGPVKGAIVKYGLTHLMGYFINLALMIFFVDRLGYPHQLVQAAAIFVVALFLFTTFIF